MSTIRPADAQYSLGKILAIWAAVALPMPLMAFWLAPGVATKVDHHPMLVTWYFLIAGMVWQFVLSVLLLRRELDEFTWRALSERIWLHAPSDPRSGERRWSYLWYLVPAFAFYAIFEMTPLEDVIGRLILIPFPMLARLPELDLGVLALEELAGAWWLVPIALVSSLFNYLLGEELLFRGVLLPRMEGVFGRWDWVANSALFALYHLHRPVQMLAFIFGGLAWSFPSRRFRSIWFAIILHGIEGVFLIVGVYSVVAGTGP